MLRYRLPLYALILFATASAAIANDGQLDTSWGIVNSGTTAINFFSGGQKLSSVGWAVAAEPDGKVVVAGDVTSTRGDTDFGVARLLPNGLADTSFGSGGIAMTDINSAIHSDDHARGVAIQPDGKIVVVGWASTSSGGQEAVVVRYNTDGTLDQSFNNGGIFADNYGGTSEAEFWAVALQPDGKIVYGGWTNVGGDGDFLVARLLPDGTSDSAFGINGGSITGLGPGSQDYIAALTIASNGTIYVGGHSTAGSGGDNFAIASYSSNGTFNGAITRDYSGNDDAAAAIGLEPDGKIVTAGNSYSNGQWDFAYFRANANGTTDSSFGPGSPAGWVRGGIMSQASGARGLVIQPNGKIVAAGYWRLNNDYDLQIQRLNTDGSVDLSFGTLGRTAVGYGDGHNEIGRAIAFAPDGELFVAGSTDATGHSEMEVLKFTDSEGATSSAGGGTCVADSTHLCLTGNRFRVSVEWTNYNTNVTAPATAVPFRDESGFFYFQDPNKIEVMVQVKDACQSFQHFWLFYAATTDVAYTLTVTDTTTNQTETYSNPAHSLAVAGTDETDFGACP